MTIEQILVKDLQERTGEGRRQHAREVVGESENRDQINLNEDKLKGGMVEMNRAEGQGSSSSIEYQGMTYKD